MAVLVAGISLNVTAKMTVAGAIWEFKQKPGLLTDVTFESNIHNQDHVVFKDFMSRLQFAFQLNRLLARSGTTLLRRRRLRWLARRAHRPVQDVRR